MFLSSSNWSEEDYLTMHDAKPEDTVRRYARIAADAGVRSVMCAAADAWVIKQDPDIRHLTVYGTGTRSTGDPGGEHKRIVTPEVALRNGVDFLVIGTPIVKTNDPYAALLRYGKEITQAQHHAWRLTVRHGKCTPSSGRGGRFGVKCARKRALSARQERVRLGHGVASRLRSLTIGAPGDANMAGWLLGGARGSPRRRNTWWITLLVTARSIQWGTRAEEAAARVQVLGEELERALPRDRRVIGVVAVGAVAHEPVLGVLVHGHFVGMVRA